MCMYACVYIHMHAHMHICQTTICVPFLDATSSGSTLKKTICAAVGTMPACLPLSPQSMLCSLGAGEPISKNIILASCKAIGCQQSFGCGARVPNRKSNDARIDELTSLRTYIDLEICIVSRIITQ